MRVPSLLLEVKAGEALTEKRRRVIPADVFVSRQKTSSKNVIREWGGEGLVKSESLHPSKVCVSVHAPTLGCTHNILEYLLDSCQLYGKKT